MRRSTVMKGDEAPRHNEELEMLGVVTGSRLT